MKLALDHHYSPTISEQLRRRGHDVVAAQDRGWQHEDDEALLVICVAEGRTLLTNNVGDLSVIAQRWAAEGRHHYGLIFTSDSNMPRHRDTIGRYVTALDRIHRTYSADDALRDQIHWL